MPNEYREYPNAHAIDKLVSVAQQKLGIKKRSDVHEVIGVPASAASKIRNGHVAVSAEMVLRLYDATGMDVNTIREMLGHKKFVYTPPIATNAQSSGE